MRFFYLLIAFTLVSGCQNSTPFQAKEKPRKTPWTCQSSPSGEWQCDQSSPMNKQAQIAAPTSPSTSASNEPAKELPIAYKPEPVKTIAATQTAPAPTLKQAAVAADNFPSQGWCLQAIATQDKQGVLKAFAAYELNQAWYITTERNGVEWHHLVLSTHDSRDQANEAKKQLSIPSGYPALWAREINQLTPLITGNPKRLTTNNR